MDIAVFREKLARTSASSKYVVIVFVSVVLYLFFFSTGFLFPYNGKLYATPVGTALKVSDYTSLILKRWEYDPQQAMMEVEIFVEDAYNNYRTELTPIVITRRDMLTPLPVQVTVRSRELLVLHIFSVPSRFDAVALTFTSGTAERSVKFYCDVRSVAHIGLVIKSEPEYWRQSLEHEISEVEQEIADSRATVEDIKKSIQVLQSDIVILEGDKGKQILSQRQKTDQYIRQKKLEIEVELTNIHKQQEQQQALTERLLKAREKLKNL